MSFIEEMADKFVAEGFGVRVSASPTIFFGPKAAIPGGNGRYIQMSETGGAGPVNTQNESGIAYERPSLQIVVTAPTRTLAFALAWSLYYSCAFSNLLLGTTWYVWCRPDQQPFDLTVDIDDRPRAAFNITAEKRKS